MAVGRLGVAYSDSRPPRLVVDSSVCGVNARCRIPEKTTLPTAKDVIRCYPLRGSNAELAGFSLDIKSAHKRVVVRQEEQGLLGFQIDGKLFFYRVCPFGATFSAFWWQRVGGWILRFFHLFIWLSHSAFLYVDDYFWIQRKDIIHLTSTTLAMLCRCLGIPISWRKCELSHTVQWIGWTFHIAAGYISLPEDKRTKWVKYIKSLIAHNNRIPRNQLEKTIGLAMWVTQLFPFMRIWLQYLYADLHNHPATNYSMDPGSWPTIAEHLSPDLIFTSQPSGTRIPVGGRLVSARHQELTSLDDLSKVRITDKRLWMRIKDPTSDKRILSVSSKRILNILLTWLNHVSPYVLLKPKPLWTGLAAADAYAQGAACGIGGFIKEDESTIRWFSEQYSLQDFQNLEIPLQDDLQKSISALETLAQIAILWIASKLYPGQRFPITLPSFSDNTGAESGSNRLFTTKFPLCLFLEKMCLMGALYGMELDVHHISGPTNCEADALSRWSGAGPPPYAFDASDRIRIPLKSLWIPVNQPSLVASHAFILWKLPGSTT